MPSQPEPRPETPFDHEAALAACAGGDRMALQRIYQHDSRSLLGVALRIVRDRAVAEDVLHDAFVRIWSGAAGFDAARGSARGWIYSVVRYAALNHRRDHAREVVLDEDSHQAAGDLASLAAHAERTDPFELRSDLGRLDHCLQALPTERRACILHAYLDGFSHGEIAALMQKPLGTVKAWIQRSLGALRECMV